MHSSKQRKSGPSQPDRIFKPEQLVAAHEAMHQLRIAVDDEPNTLGDAMDSFVGLQRSPYEKSPEPRRRLARSTIETTGFLAKIFREDEREEKTQAVKRHRIQSFERMLFGGSNYNREEERRKLELLKERGMGTGSSVLKNAGKNALTKL